MSKWFVHHVICGSAGGARIVILSLPSVILNEVKDQVAAVKPAT